MKRHKPYSERDHSVSKKAKDLRRAMTSQSHGKPTNVGDPNNMHQGQKKKDD